MRVLIGLICVALASSPALAGKPEWAGNDKHEKQQSKEMKKAKVKAKSEEKAKPAKADKKNRTSDKKQYFAAHDHDLIREYYAEEGVEHGHKGGKVKDLPPGLQKKLDRGGELPPGWQRKLERGEVVDREVRSYAHPVPESLAARLPYDAATEEIIRIQDKVIRMSRGEGTIIDVIDIADVFVGRGMRE
ncbi:hypothetical protein IOQ59_18715 [Pontibacterium sp. N1Y112]|uniref:RcnB family protein n=1 Tax=Pontibacterium sinense TaxID=2781979 RepID=A0A8J7FN00_9GAMM|nr:hypothetical protein [Pontibacterium sinense]MBE9399298.1 hypothetical protein [Pontibacterium sinense]